MHVMAKAHDTSAAAGDKWLPTLSRSRRNLAPTSLRLDMIQACSHHVNA